MTHAAEWPDNEALRALAAMQDPVGFLSVYIDADPVQQTSPRPPWAIEIKNGIEAILGELRAHGPREHWVAVRDLVGDLEPELDRMMRGAEPGRGRVMLVPVSDPARAWRMQMQLPLTTGVALDSRPHLMPLIAARDRGRPVGVVAVARPELRLYDHRMGVLRELARFEFDDASDEWREMKGPAAANPAVAQHTAPQRDRFERRLGEHRRQFLVATAEPVVAASQRNRWEAILLVGDPRLTGILAEPLGGNAGVPVAVDEALLEVAHEPELAERVDRLRHDRQAGLIGAVSGAVGEDRAVTGVADVLAALQAGRAGHLLLRDGLRLEGVRGADGVLRAPGAGPEDGEPEPQLAERMIELALASSAEVTVVHPELAGPLEEGQGVAALLRW